MYKFCLLYVYINLSTLCISLSTLCIIIICLPTEAEGGVSEGERMKEGGRKLSKILIQYF